MQYITTTVKTKSSQCQPTLSSLVALAVVITITPGAISDNKVGIMMIEFSIFIASWELRVATPFGIQISQVSAFILIWHSLCEIRLGQIGYQWETWSFEYWNVDFSKNAIRYVAWHLLLRLLSWYPFLLSSHCNSFEDWVPVYLI